MIVSRCLYKVASVSKYEKRSRWEKSRKALSDGKPAAVRGAQLLSESSRREASAHNRDPFSHH